MKLFSNSRLPAWLLLAAVLSTATSCAGGHGSLSHKTRWYKHHSGGKSVPCPCGH